MTQLSDKLTNFIQQMPKAEIHIHLEGAIQPKTVLELAKRHDKLNTLPSDTEEGLRRWFTFTDFPHFVEIYLTIQDLIRTADDFALIVYENGADMAAQNIRYRELTVTPYTHTSYQDKGLTFAELFEGLENGRLRAKEEYGVEMRWVFDIARNLTDNPDGSYDPTPAEKTLEYALEGKAKGSVVGLGLGGYEVGYPPEHIPSFTWGGGEGSEKYQIEKALETARAVMQRRKQEMTPAQEALLRKIYQATTDTNEKSK